MVINHVLTADNRSEVHFNAKLSTPWCEVLKDLSITFSIKEDRHSACARRVHAKGWRTSTSMPKPPTATETDASMLNTSKLERTALI